MNALLLLPLVSIGVPCYNRPAGLKRALESICAQTYLNLEIIISDNCSNNNEVRKIAEYFCNIDSRIKYFRHEYNQGATRNFDFLRQQAHGNFFLWLADDDFLDVNYVEECVTYLLSNPDCVLAGGIPSYICPDGSTYEGQQISFLSDSPEERMVDYFSKVDDNGIFYGVYISSILRRVKIHDVLAGDWIFISEIAYLGKIKMLSSTTIHREASHLFISEPMKKLCASYGLPSYVHLFPYFWIAMVTRTLVKEDQLIENSKTREYISKKLFEIIINRWDKRTKSIKEILIKFRIILFFFFWRAKYLKLKIISII